MHCLLKAVACEKKKKKMQLNVDPNTHLNTHLEWPNTQ